MNIKDCIFYSGGADGADTVWENELKKIGGKVVVYRPYHIENLSKEDLEVVEKQYREVVKRLGRKEMPVSRFAGRLVRRDMLQVKDAKSVYAIGMLDKSNGLVKGGTGYATTRAAIMGLNVYLFEQDLAEWWKWSYDLGGFVRCDEDPVLDTRSTVVGTREINESGLKAIRDIIKRSFR